MYRERWRIVANDTEAGVLEVADLLIVNKADLPDAARTAVHLKAMLHHRGESETGRVLQTSTVTDDGLRRSHPA